MSIEAVLSGAQPWHIEQGDSFALVDSLPAESVDLVATSPPYNYGSSPSALKHPSSHRGNGKNWQGYHDDADTLPEWIYQWQQVQMLDMLFRAVKPSGSLFYIHKDRLWNGASLDPRDWLLRSEWTIRQRVVWDRGSGHRMDGWHFLPCHEYVFWLTKGELRERNLGSAKMWTSIWRVNAPQGDYAPWHPAPFPVALASRCIVAMSNPGDLVLDPYSGAASTGVAALQSERRYLGFERVPEYIAKSQERLSSYQRPLIIHNRLDGAA